MRPTPHRRRGSLARIRARLRGDAGWVGTVFLLIGTLFLILAALQAALWAVGTNTAQAASQAAYTAARAYQSDPAAGRASAQALIGSGRGLTDPTVIVTRTPDQVTVTVTGNVRSILPGITLPPVTRSITGPVERWVPAP